MKFKKIISCVLSSAILFNLMAVSSGDSVFTFTKDIARGVVSATGLGVVGPESHWAWYKIGDYYWHYHTGNRKGAHVWYGLAI